ncbi:hypothetical protein GBF38_001124 [Nibea albiflora]|uniref:Uncharacterized protein n=1 Tax=Nibea albiflora TaxID=240163 RepID=A0ACB7EGG4_NIBAL|nr:hypothetical protein GBF38_001124 [Nibea albiflora]
MLRMKCVAVVGLLSLLSAGHSAPLSSCDSLIKPISVSSEDVNISMKMSDIEFEVRRLLSTPGAVPPHFQHPKIIRQARMYAKILTEQQQKDSESKLLCPLEVVLEVVPKVLQGFWLPPPNTSFNMPSQQLSKMAVGVTKEVQDRVSKTLSSMLLQATGFYSAMCTDHL